MKVELYTLRDFFVINDIARVLRELLKNNRQFSFLKEELDELKEKASSALKKKTPLGLFCKKYGFGIDDLELLFVSSLSENGLISIKNFLEFNPFEEQNLSDLFKIFSRLKETKIIKEGYLALENPFSNKGSFDDAYRLESLFLEAFSLSSSKSFVLEFPRKIFLTVEEAIDEINLLNELFAFDPETITTSHNTVKLLLDLRFDHLKKSFLKTKEEGDNSFSKFLRDRDVSFDEFFQLIINVEPFDVELNITVTMRFQRFFKDVKIIESLINKGFMSREHRWLAISDDVKRELFNNNGSPSKELFSLTKNPSVTFDNIFIDEKSKNLLLRVIDQEKNKRLIFDEWGLSKSLSYGKGITMNFFGPPGTGKTLTAMAVANYLNKPLYIVNLSQIESCFLGQTEKNISHAFKSAKESGAVLFFDEADSLTTSRKSAFRSWEVTRTNALLKELEQFDGVCIFATNFVESYDEAFNRRLTAHIPFNNPDAKGLVKIFKFHLSDEALGSDVDFHSLSKKFEGLFNGGDIKNIVLNAARIAASDPDNKERKIMQDHLLEACELVKNSKCLIDDEKNEVNYLG